MTGHKDFQAVFQHGTRIERPSLIVVWKESDHTRRVGFAVSRQMHGAVRRNRARRRLREAYRAARGSSLTGADLVIVARGPALTRPFESLVREVRSALGAIAERSSRGCR